MKKFAAPCVYSFLAVAGTTVSMLAPARDQVSPVHWTQPGKDGLSCSSCHSPTGREVWQSDISLEDVKRRALNHLGENDAQQLLSEVSVLRGPVQTSNFPLRPFEPRGGALRGETPTDRDQAFAETLKTSLPSLIGKKVWTLAEAEVAAKELTAVPLKDVRTGIIYDPVSRDPVRPNDGPNLGDWIADAPLDRKDTLEYERVCQKNYDAVNGYDVKGIATDLAKNVAPAETTIAHLSQLKRIALLQYSNYLETGKPPECLPLSSELPEQPIWAVGDLERRIQDMDPQSLGISEHDADRLGVKWGKPANLAPSALSWMWIGWTLDPGLQNSSLERVAKTGQYLAKAFWDAGPYPWHAAYFAARRPLEQRARAGDHEAFQPEINAFVNNVVLETQAPKDADFANFCANLLRMDCLLVQRDLGKGRKLPYPTSAKQQAVSLWNFVKTRIAESDRAKTKAILDQTYP